MCVATSRRRIEPYVRVRHSMDGANVRKTPHLASAAFLAASSALTRSSTAFFSSAALKIRTKSEIERIRRLCMDRAELEAHTDVALQPHLLSAAALASASLRAFAADSSSAAFLEAAAAASSAFFLAAAASCSARAVASASALAFASAAALAAVFSAAAFSAASAAL